MSQNIFQRYEYKYMISDTQYAALTGRLAGRLSPDQYGSYTISNLYYDTDRFDLIRASIEKPVYKEKLRLRSYGKANRDTPVFLELKKKYKGVVYKRRVTLTYGDAGRILKDGVDSRKDPQILQEIGYFLRQYPVSEKVFLCYDRTALAGTEDSRLRITFDSNIRFRQSELRLDDGTWGTGILEPGKMLMEIKIPDAFPLWLGSALSELAIFPTSFSKYGTCYRQYILNATREKTEVSASA